MLPEDAGASNDPLTTEFACYGCEVFSRLRAKLHSFVQPPAAHSATSSVSAPVAEKTQRAPLAAPVMVYFEREKNQQALEDITQLLSSRGIAYKALDVRGDAATIAFIVREAKCTDDDLPIVFVAATPVGGHEALAAWDASGKLRTAVFGA